MPISVRCADCKKGYLVVNTLAGKLIKCPKCAHPVRIPGRVAVATAAVGGDGPDPELEDNVRSVSPSVRRGAAGPGSNYRDVEDAPPLESADVPEEVSERIRDDLTKGERLVWTGKPDPKLMFMWGWVLGAGSIGFGLIFMAALWKSAFNAKPFGLIEILELIVPPALLILGFSIPFYERWKARRIYYFLTNRRAVVWKTSFGGTPHLTNYGPANLTGLRRRKWPFFGDGAGDVIFRTETTVTTTHYRGSRTGRYMGSSQSVSYKHFGFLAVRKSLEIEKMIRETLVDPLLDKLNS